jgi:hypothetical protein
MQRLLLVAGTDFWLSCAICGLVTLTLMQPGKARIGTFTTRR